MVSLTEESGTAKTGFHEQEKEASVQRELRTLVESQMRELRTEYVAIYAQIAAQKVELKLQQTSQENSNTVHEKTLSEHKVEIEKVKRSFQESLDKQEEEKVAVRVELATFKETQHCARSEELEKIASLKSDLEVLRLQNKHQKSHGILSIQEKDELINELQEKVREGGALRRKLHNTIQELRGNVRVFTRTRPYLPSDHDDERDSPLSCLPDEVSLTLQSTSKSSPQPEAYNFTFDKVFGPSSGQDDIFEEVAEFVQSSIDGYNVCLFSYGQTGSGKTHTVHFELLHNGQTSIII